MNAITGVRPTGPLHIGHYFSVIQPGRAGADVLIATYHAPRGHYAIADTLHRFGVPLNKIIRQEDVFRADIYFRLLDLATLGPLTRMTQFKSAAKQTAHLFVYPVLMAHDIMGYEEVFVGDDQKQYLEFARKLLKVFDPETPVAEPKVIGGRIRSLRDPSQKMSKSEPAGCLFLEDSDDVTRAKIRKAVTTPEGRANLIDLYRRLGGTEIPEKNLELKEALTEKFFALRK